MLSLLFVVSFSYSLASVPVYDARNAKQDFIYQLRFMTGKGSELKPFGRDVSEGSCVVLGYTVSTWVNGTDPGYKQVSFNIQWVLVLATPEDLGPAAEIEEDGEEGGEEVIEEEEVKAKEAEAEEEDDIFKEKVVKGKGKKRA